MIVGVLIVALVVFGRGSNPISQAAADAADTARTGTPGGGIV